LFYAARTAPHVQGTIRLTTPALAHRPMLYSHTTLLVKRLNHKIDGFSVNRNVVAKLPTHSGGGATTGMPYALEILNF
jgi:hypothetical protein